MRVVLATRLFAPEVAAAAFRLKALADGFAAAGHQVTVLTTTPPKTAAPQRFGDYDVRRWPVLRDSGGNVRGYVQYASFDGPLALRLLLASADVVICEPPPTTGVVTAIACLLKRKPYYYYAADVWSDALVAIGAHKAVAGFMRGLERFALRRARGVIAVSDGVAERVRELGVPADRVRVVQNGVDTTTFRPVEVTPEENYFVYTGTMSEWQGSDVFVRAMPLVLAKHPTAKLRFFGQGTAEKALRALAAELAPGSVEFGGVVPPADAARWISGAVGALASIVPGQGYDFAKPTKIYAAAACGTPMLFAGVGASAELIRDNKLGLVADYTPQAVAEQMIAMLDGATVDREHLVDWVGENASLATTGRVAAAWVAEDMA
ncbi:glycosyltransferase family 4 protein [Actinokineospora sp. UTMC 2448]|uniref:glycosyltransferase family 4 protein n=1 Tax=Actinokineospora sp. UTMC 2448 TaxID=2268449 RepID=UPI002164DA84|nr:glycosyltransferase family 4 protein [Actinokineospora sp. UTMC 2448]UVS82443.1 GDP-mannose-dependent alpha-(1-6)-phosphatidylinositol monomannoside mannosyltransferase [Actinokineospora sp. UTMC 2448]